MAEAPIVMSIAWTWGTEPAERALVFPCDAHLRDASAQYFRGISVRASPAVLYRWLCQLRAAPYSYDWIDNGGRRSPRTLTPGMEQLALGQSVMRIFSLVAFEAPRHLTLRLKPGSMAARFFGDVAVSYVVVPQGSDSCRLLVKLLVRYPPGLHGSLLAWWLPWGDLAMMRRQLQNLKTHAERQATRPCPAADPKPPPPAHRAR
jgi:hypothetical protein